MKKLLMITVVVLSAALFVNMVQGRTWTDKKGHKITAEFVSLLQQDEPKAKLLTPAGKVLEVPVRNLCDEDQKYITNLSVSAVYSAVKDLSIDSRDAYDALIHLRDKDLSRIEPDYTIALLFIFKKKDYLHAQQHFNRCLKIKPDDIGTLLNMGTLCILQGRYPEAFTYYQKVYLLGGANQTLDHNLQKLIEESVSRNIHIPAAALHKIAELTGKVSSKVKAPFDQKRGWMFEMCSEGTSQEMHKCHWFQIYGYRPYEFPICMKCKGTGKVECPNKNCSGGKASIYINKTKRYHNGEKITEPVREVVVCNICKGKNYIPCPVCNGAGVEFQLEKWEIDGSSPPPKSETEKRGGSQPKQEQNPPRQQQPVNDNQSTRMAVDVQDLESLQEDAAESRRFFGLEDDDEKQDQNK